MKPAIITENISKSFNGISVLEDISLQIEPSRITGIIGPDGAGKTTFLRILISLEHADKGRVVILDKEIPRESKELKGLIGYMPGRFSLYTDLTVKENLNFYARIHNTTLKENYQIIKPIYSQIEPFNNRIAGKLSGGMKQKLALCCALISSPSLLLLDEPTTGVDAVSRKDFWEILRLLADSGLTVMLSTPYMDEANLCDKIILFHKGQILFNNTPGELLKNFSMELFRLSVSNLFEVRNDLAKCSIVKDVSIFGRELHLATVKNDSTDQLLIEYIKSKEYGDFRLEKILPCIEDCFIDLVSIKLNSIKV